MNEDINFLATLPSLDDDNDHEYDKFLLEILKQKEEYNVNMCSKCGGTITSYANDILNQKYPRNNIPYFIDFDDMSKITDKNISEEKLQIIKNISNDASLERWEKIHKVNITKCLLK